MCHDDYHHLCLSAWAQARLVNNMLFHCRTLQPRRVDQGHVMKIQLGTSDPRERALSLDSNPDNRPSFHVKVSFTSLIVLTLSAPWVATSLPGLEDT